MTPSKLASIAGTITGMIGMLFSSPVAVARAGPQAGKSVSDFTLTSLTDGKPLPLSQFKGKAILLVNTASMCGFTPQYDGLEKLHTTYEAKGFTVLGVPSGDFLGQEYGTSKEISEFCRTKYGIKFPMAEKVHVKGKDAIPLYKWASTATNSPPGWNFHKYLIGRDGKVIAAFNSKVKPDAPELVKAIEDAISKPAMP
jgi:glutathione peroxidase